MEARTFAPPPDLADVVAALWTGRWDLRGQPPHTTELLGDPCLHVVVEDGDGGPDARVVGVWTRLWRRTLQGRGRVLGVKLLPGAAGLFFAPPAHALSNRVTPLRDLMGDESIALQRDVLTAGTDDAFARLCDGLRPRRRADRAADASLAVALVRAVTADTSITDVATLSVRAGLCERALQRVFRAHVGASPKWVIRRHRLQEAALRIERGEVRSLADLAASLGYADQSHLARDFKAAVGRSPRDFAAMLHPSPTRRAATTAGARTVRRRPPAPGPWAPRRGRIGAGCPCSRGGCRAARGARRDRPLPGTGRSG
ncbi:MAG: helix-turn-helix transcriptional regulator [Polyangiales bacterium]